MSGMILCRTREAEHPFEIKDMGIHIHNLEELCYYIYNNIYIIGTELLNQDLVAFIRDEIREPSLAKSLSDLLSKNAGLAQMVVTILKYVDYYNEEEIEAIQEILGTLNTQNTRERLKLRADSFLGNRCYYSAIDNYAKIIQSSRDPSLPGIFYARVFHNMGVAFARMFLYREAARYFKQAYKIGQHEDSKRCYLFAKQLLRGDAVIQKTDTTDIEYQARKSMETAMDNARYSDEYRSLQEIERLKEEGSVNEYYQKIDQKIESWKADYTKYTSR